MNILNNSIYYEVNLNLTCYLLTLRKRGHRTLNSLRPSTNRYNNTLKTDIANKKRKLIATFT